MKLLKLTALIGLCLLSTLATEVSTSPFTDSTPVDETEATTEPYYDETTLPEETNAPSTTTSDETDAPSTTTLDETDAPSSTPTPGTTTTTGTTQRTSSTTERPPHLCPIDDDMPPPEACPPQEDTPTYMSYPYDCRKYFICANGVAICQRCPTGTVWDQEHTICDREANVGCNIVTTTPSYNQENRNSIVEFMKKFKFF